MESKNISVRVNEIASDFGLNIKFAPIKTEKPSTNVVSELPKVEIKSCKHVDILPGERITARQLGYIPEAYLRGSCGELTVKTDPRRAALDAEFAAIKRDADAKRREYQRRQYLKSLGVR